ncbi:MAG: MBL fold metallo-hydrolase, partial [SAR202 cluster bacterium]|nr:MBL fold metallo-hydrolase [SAR202 cluster bacterium]
PGHQIVFVESGSKRIVFTGDLIPTAHHLAIGCISAHDHTPNDSLDMKRDLLETAAKDGWMLVFGHAFEQRAGYIETRNGRTQFTPVEM